MPTVRFWQPQDLPYLLPMAAKTAWNITPEGDKPFTTFETVAGNAHRNVINILQSPGGTAIVAEEGGRPVGYMLIGIQPHERTGEPQGYLADIYVEPPFRRLGISKELHRMTDDYLRQLGLRRVTNWTHAHNPLGQGASGHQNIRIIGLVLAKDLRRSGGA